MLRRWHGISGVHLVAVRDDCRRLMSSGGRSLIAGSAGDALEPVDAVAKDRNEGDAASRRDRASSAPVAAAAARNFKGLKVKKKAPWGERQLRDSWTDEAMSNRENEKIGKRLTSKHRYHPDVWTRKAYMTAGISFLFLMVCSVHYMVRAVARAEGMTPRQVYRRSLRSCHDGDFSPRSNMKPFKLVYDNPPNIVKYRKAAQQRKLKQEEEQRLAAANSATLASQ
jgi:hypothetical protein